MKQADHSTFELEQVSGMLSDLFNRHIDIQASTDRPCCFSQALRFMRSPFLLIKLVAHVGDCKGIRHMLVSVLACYIVVSSEKLAVNAAKSNWRKFPCVEVRSTHTCCEISRAAAANVFVRNGRI